MLGMGVTEMNNDVNDAIGKIVNMIDGDVKHPDGYLRRWVQHVGFRFNGNTVLVR